VVKAPGVGFLGPVDLRLAALARLQGDPAAAADLYRRSIAACEQLGADPFAAIARLGLARALADDPAVPATTALAELSRAQPQLAAFGQDGFTETALALRQRLEGGVSIAETLPMTARHTPEPKR